MTSLLRAVSHEPLTDAECRSLAPARAKRLAYSLAGRARYLYELVTGESAAGDGLATPLNPQGFGGVDRSGPPWGDALMHPVWMLEGTLVGIYGADGAAVVPDGQNSVVRLLARFWVRPYQRGPSVPYSKVYLRAEGTRIPMAGTATAEIRVYGPDGEAGSYSAATVSTTSSASFSTGAYTRTTPGWNERIIDVIQTGAIGIAVTPIALCQVARRSH